MPRVRSKIVYLHVSDFDKDRIVAYRIAVYRITVLLFASVEINLLVAEYGIEGFRAVIWNAILVLNGSLSLAIHYAHGLNGSCSHVTSHVTSW
ncbi:hypothetical protein TNCV_5031961 [Trichonephila clavipes]|nr:hypothetical protein TNCV_5031961 [Trichonephila clavipes]